MNLTNLTQENKMTKQTWSTPVLTNYGAASKITQQNVDFNKKFGSGDSIVLVVNGISSVVNVPTGGSLIDITNNGNSVP